MGMRLILCLPDQSPVHCHQACINWTQHHVMRVRLWKIWLTPSFSCMHGDTVHRNQPKQYCSPILYETCSGETWASKPTRWVTLLNTMITLRDRMVMSSWALWSWWSGQCHSCCWSPSGCIDHFMWANSIGQAVNYNPFYASIVVSFPDLPTPVQIYPHWHW